MSAEAEKNIHSDKRKKLFGIIAIAIFILFFTVIFIFVGNPLIRFLHDPERFRQWVADAGIWGRLGFIGMVVLQVVVAIIPGEPFEIGAGYAFGFWEGTALSLIGAALGSILIFLFVRRWGIKVVEIFFSREKILSLRFLQNQKRVELVVFLIMLIPGTPKDLLSYFVGLTDIKLSTWITISVFARLPSLVSSTLGGNALGEKNYITAGIAFVAAAVLSLCGIAVYRLICRRNASEKPGSDTLT